MRQTKLNEIYNKLRDLRIDDTRCYISWLFAPILAKIFGYFDIDDIINIYRTCKRFKTIVSSESMYYEGINIKLYDNNVAEQFYNTIMIKNEFKIKINKITI